MIDNNFLINEKSKNIPFLFTLTVVWLILLSLCALIGLLIVPIQSSSDSYVVQLIFGGGKVLISLTFVMVWLIGWYRVMNYLLYFQFYVSDLNSVPKEN